MISCQNFRQNLLLNSGNKGLLFGLATVKSHDFQWIVRKGRLRASQGPGPLQRKIMSNISIAASLAFFFVVFVSCDNESQSRNNANGNKKRSTGVEAGESSGEGGEGLGEGEGQERSSTAGSGEAKGSDDSLTVNYAADESLYYTTFAKSAFDTHCVSCHPSNIPSLTNFESIRNNAEDVKESLINGTMPPGNSLPDDLRIKMVNWILAGPKKAPFTLSFEMPTRLDTPVVGNTAEIKVLLANNKPDATWKLFYSVEPDASTGGTLIGSERLISEGGTVSWNTSTIPPGTYYLYAELKEGSQTSVVNAAGSFRIGLPSIVLGQGWREGKKGFLSTADLTYSVQHTDSTKNYLVDLAVKKGDGSFQNINQAVHSDLTKFRLPGSYTFSDDIDYTFRVILLENGTSVHSVESLSHVGVANAPVLYSSLRSSFIDSDCGSCHVAPSPFLSALYNTPAGAFAKAALIVERMHDAESPMPPTGLSSEQNRIKVKLWYWLGAAP
jgi:hypothetical protein